MNNHAKREISAFTDFIKIVDIPISISTVEKREPPEPDIYCKTTEGKPLAFELVELVEENFEKQNSITIKTVDMLKSYHKSLKPERKSLFDSKFKDTKIYIDFKNDTTLRQREKHFSAIFDYLLQIKDDAVPGFWVDEHLLPVDCLEKIAVHREEGIDTILFHSTSDTFIENPVRKILTKKLSRTYETNHPIHLLAYIDGSPIYDENIWVPEIFSFLKSNIDKSLFKKIWIFDRKEERIVLTV